jgi:hypothetical protein
MRRERHNNPFNVPEYPLFLNPFISSEPSPTETARTVKQNNGDVNKNIDKNIAIRLRMMDP